MCTYHRGKENMCPLHYNGQWERSVREEEPVRGCDVVDAGGWMVTGLALESR